MQRSPRRIPARRRHDRRVHGRRRRDSRPQAMIGRRSRRCSSGPTSQLLLPRGMRARQRWIRTSPHGTRCGCERGRQRSCLASRPPSAVRCVRAAVTTTSWRIPPQHARAWDDGDGASHERPCGRRRLEPRPSRRGGQRCSDPRERPAVVAVDDRPRGARGAGVRGERAGGEGAASREPHRVADDPRRPELVLRRAAGLQRVAALHRRLRRRRPHRRDPDPPRARVPERATFDAGRAAGDGGDVRRRAGAAAGVDAVRRPPRAQVRRMPAQRAADRARRAARGRARHRHAHRRAGDPARRPGDPRPALARGVAAVAAGARTRLPRLRRDRRLRRHPDGAGPVDGGSGWGCSSGCRSSRC